MKLNREEIIKALEYCTGIKQIDACANCPAHLGCNDCVDFLREESLALIKELTDENEKLRDTIDEVADINSVWVNDCIRMSKQIKTIKADTVKQMQERLLYEWDWCAYDADEAPDVISQVAKELLEEKNDV